MSIIKSETGTNAKINANTARAGTGANSVVMGFSLGTTNSAHSKNLPEISPSAAANAIRGVRENLTAQDLGPSIQTLRNLMTAYQTADAPAALLGGAVGIEVRALGKALPGVINSMEKWISSLSPLGMTDDPGWHFNEGARLYDLREMQKSVDELNRFIDAKWKNLSTTNRC